MVNDDYVSRLVNSIDAACSGDMMRLNDNSLGGHEDIMARQEDADDDTTTNADKILDVENELRGALLMHKETHLLSADLRAKICHQDLSDESGGPASFRSLSIGEHQ